MLSRKLGKILRGDATPFQLVAACFLGSLLGFAPGIGQAPALILILVTLLLVLNANLGLALLVAGLAKVLSLLLVSVSFQIGRFLLDGPLSGLAEVVVNAPVLAWCGLERYAVSGGLVLGTVMGLVLGTAVSRSIGGLRRKVVAAGQDPGKLQALGQKGWARFLIWLVLGGKGKRTWEERVEKRVGNPIRIWGAALVVLVVGGLWFAQHTLAGPLAKRWLGTGLERANGATVDLDTVSLELAEGNLAVTGLALADPNALEQDLLRATELAADLDQSDLLRRRIHVARVAVRDAKTGAPRDTPGVRIAPPAEEADEEDLPPIEPGDLSLEDVMEDVELWRERLSQARRWLDKLSGEPSTETESEESYSDRLARQVEQEGWYSVTAGHLLKGAPAFRLSELVVDGLASADMPDRVFDLKAQELSSHPGLVDAPPRLDLTSRDGAIAMAVDLAPVSATGGEGEIRFAWKGLVVDDVMKKLKLPGPAPLQGGTLDLELDGAWLDGRIGHVDLPLRATFHDTVLHMEGTGPTSLDELALAIGLRGPIDSPRIRFDRSTLVDALTAAGKKELANRLQAELGDELGDLSEKTGIEVPEEVPTDLEGAKGLLDGLRKKD